MDFVPGAAEFRAVVTAQSSRSDDGDFHAWINGLLDKWIIETVHARAAIHPFIQTSINPLHQRKRRSESSERLVESNGLLRAENGVLGGFGHLELHHALGGNLDGFAGRRIAALASGAVLELELAEAGQRESVLGVLVSQISQRFEILDGLLLRDANLLGERRGDL